MSEYSPRQIPLRIWILKWKRMGDLSWREKSLQIQGDNKMITCLFLFSFSFYHICYFRISYLNRIENINMKVSNSLIYFRSIREKNDENIFDASKIEYKGNKLWRNIDVLLLVVVDWKSKTWFI